MRYGHAIVILAVTGIPVSALSDLALAQQRGDANTNCSNVQAGTMTFRRCQGQSIGDVMVPKSNGTTDPAAVGKPYGAWDSRFGGQGWQSPRR
jgi:hypothetical protein